MLTLRLMQLMCEGQFRPMQVCMTAFEKGGWYYCKVHVDLWDCLEAVESLRFLKFFVHFSILAGYDD